MPELPEVETIKNQICPYLPFKVKKIFLSPFAESIVKNHDFNPQKKTIYKVQRHGKVIIFHLENRLSIVSGLGMSGSWRISKQKINDKHTHVQFFGTQQNGQEYFLGYVDPRRFGYIHYFANERMRNWLDRLGPDVSTEQFNLAYLKDLVAARPNKILKPFLLDQSFFAGIGNYMASEICARAGVLPTRPLASLKTSEQQAIIEATRSVVFDSIQTGGTTFSGGYTDAHGKKGEGVKNLIVFFQKFCGQCNGPVTKISLASRGTYYCSKCQF